MAAKGLDVEDTPPPADPIPLMGTLSTASGIVVMRRGLIVRLSQFARPRLHARTQLLIAAAAIFRQICSATPLALRHSATANRRPSQRLDRPRRPDQVAASPLEVGASLLVRQEGATPLVQTLAQVVAI